MSGVAIRLEGLGKRYRLGAREGYKTLRDSLTNAVYALFGHQGVKQDGNAEHLWALQSVSFDVKWGEVLGIIGANGAGKTTLLKVLSRITEPTEGTITVHGRVGSIRS
jgi:lipopolysaccharide transport system ATP-binding protein